jgi:hypothetical protein
MSKITKLSEEEDLTGIKKLIYWIMEKRIYFFSILSSLVFLNIILYRLMPLFNKKSPNEISLVEKSYLDCKETRFLDKQKLNELKVFLNKFPNLKPKYESLIVQDLLLSANTLSKEDLKIAKSSIGRIKDELPFYHEFSMAALLINQKEFKKALDISKKLKEKMLKDLSFLKSSNLPAGSVLYSFNLLRIALLESKENNTKEELVAWLDLEDYLKVGNHKELNENIKIASQTLNELFKENDIELKDYISFRKSALSS